VVCSACGFENEPSMRFCGMCGTPLPHRPLTTPGAQSTLNLTRMPVESGTVSHERLAPSAAAIGSHEVASGNGGRASAIADSTTASSATPIAGAPAKELVPDVPLDEYLQKFHYEPPADPAEVTMRGDAAPSPEMEAPASPASPQESPMGEDASASSRPVLVTRSNATDAPEPQALEQARPAVPDDTILRLGIEPEAPEEERIQRPRFLDINEPAKEELPTSGTATIVGPSFLGLSDAPQIAAETLPEDADEVERPTHWRGWLAVAILLIFAALGVAQWRAQTGNGPLQVIKAKLYSLRHGNTPSTNTQSGTTDPLAADTIPKPETPTVQPNPQGAANSNSQVATPTGSIPTTPPQNALAAAPSSTTQASSPQAAASNQNATVKPQSPPTIDNSQTAMPAEKTPAKAAPQTAAAQSDAGTPPPKPKRTSDDTADQPRSKQGVPGADEMAKAKNASDAAASAAWLWKATAKGNPEAPVQLADLYIKGSGVPRSCEQAVVLLKTAAEKENALARNRLASMYATGNCVQRNRIEAYRWLSAALSANPDSQWAQQNRDIIWNQMTPDEQAAAQKYR
jgi:zinc-ribbon domain/Sel1 repeat